MMILVFIITSKNSTIRKVVVTSEMTMSIKNSSNDVEHDFFYDTNEIVTNTVYKKGQNNAHRKLLL